MAGPSPLWCSTKCLRNRRRVLRWIVRVTSPAVARSQHNDQSPSPRRRPPGAVSNRYERAFDPISDGGGDASCAAPEGSPPPSSRNSEPAARWELPQLTLYADHSTDSTITQRSTVPTAARFDSAECKDLAGDEGSPQLRGPRELTRKLLAPAAID